MEALNWTSSNTNCSKRIFISDQNIWRAIQGLDAEINWRLEHNVNEIKQIINLLTNAQIDLIPWDWNKLTTIIAGNGFNVTHISMFHQGLEKTHWLMYLITSFGFLLQFVPLLVVFQLVVI